MVLFIILGVVVLITFIVLGALFFMLSKEGKKEEKVVPITGLEELKKGFSSQLFEQNNHKVIEKGSEIIPVFTPKASKDPISSISQSSFQAQSGEKQPSLEDEKYKKSAKELEDELHTISQKAEGQSDEAKQLIETLTKENESLKSQQVNLEQAQEKLIELQGEASSLKTENAGLQTQLESTNGKVRLLEEAMAVVKIQMGEEISRANATVQSLLSASKPDPDEALRHELESLKSENIQLKQKYEDLERANQTLQYELIKARAQSSGLERVSFNYKNQLEDFFKKVNAVQVSNDNLSQVKNRLEGMVQEVKSQNEELVKKDQLAQFELEKNRSRLVSLEHEYEDFKARAQQKG